MAASGNPSRDAARIDTVRLTIVLASTSFCAQFHNYSLYHSMPTLHFTVLLLGAGSCRSWPREGPLRRLARARRVTHPEPSFRGSEMLQSSAICVLCAVLLFWSRESVRTYIESWSNLFRDLVIFRPVTHMHHLHCQFRLASACSVVRNWLCIESHRPRTA